MILPSNTQIIRKVAEMYFKIGKGVKKGPMHTSIYIFKILFFYFLNLFCCVREFLSCRQSTTILKVFPGPKIVCIVVHICGMYTSQWTKIRNFFFLFLKFGFSEIVRGLCLMVPGKVLQNLPTHTYCVYLLHYFIFHFYRLLLLLLKYLYCLPSNAIFC